MTTRTATERAQEFEDWWRGLQEDDPPESMKEAAAIAWCWMRVQRDTLRAALAPPPCPGVSHPGCNYLTACGTVCTKCGQFVSVPPVLAPPQEGEPTITVSGPVACGKSFVMELIYKALRDAGLHPYSDDLAHERRMVDGQPPPPTKVWKLREAARLLRATQAQPLTDAQIVEIRDDHLPSQGEPFDCLAFARAVLRATQSNETKS